MVTLGRGNGKGVVVAGDVLRKKLAAGQPVAVDGGPGADRAWRLAFARATRDMMHLPVDFVGLSVARISLAELLDLPPDHALILMLEGPEDGLGLLILSPDLLSGMVEVLTVGKCGTTGGDTRKPTRTDAAMLSPLADLALGNLEDALAEEADLIWTSGFRYASFIEEARSLALLMEDVAYRSLSAKLSLSNGARVGEMILVLPADGCGRKPKVRSRSLPSAVARPAFSAALAARVDSASAQLDAVLARLAMPLAEVMHLSVDMVLPLPKAHLDQISVEGLDGRRVSDGRLGQNRGMRALRLTHDAGQAVGDVAQPGTAGFAAVAFGGETASTLSPTAVAFSAGAAGAAGFAAPDFDAAGYDFPPFDATGTD